MGRGAREQCAADCARLVGQLGDEARVDAQLGVAGAAGGAGSAGCVGVDWRAAGAWHGEELPRFPEGEEVEFGEDDG